MDDIHTAALQQTKCESLISAIDYNSISTHKSVLLHSVARVLPILFPTECWTAVKSSVFSPAGWTECARSRKEHWPMKWLIEYRWCCSEYVYDLTRWLIRRQQQQKGTVHECHLHVLVYNWWVSHPLVNAMFEILGPRTEGDFNDYQSATTAGLLVYLAAGWVNLDHVQSIN